MAENQLSCVAILCVLVACTATKGSNNDAGNTEELLSNYQSKYFKVGDPRYCLEVGKNGKLPVQRFEVLPGIGWDNLVNEPRGQVIGFNYSKCFTSDDGRYLVPDQVFTIPLKESVVDTFAEMIDTWHNTSSTTSNTINVNAGLDTTSTSISGSFSRDNVQIKMKQTEDKATTVRVQLRYNRYKAQLQPDSELHPAFKRRLLDIAAHLANNETEMAHYSAQLIVRDFGTHVQTSIIAGAGLVKTDFVKREYVAKQSEDKTSILTSASASFSNFFQINVSYGHTKDTGDYETYLKAMTHSFVTSHGGPVLRAFNMSANDWTNDLDLELVAMDRTGDPLSFLITAQTLPEIPINMVLKVEKVVRQAIMQYYEMNTIAGCTKMGSPNFVFSANFDDGSCEAQATNLTFGGVFQTCSVSGKFLYHDPCTNMKQVNPKTRDFSCPPSYTAVRLTTSRKSGDPESQTDCYDCGFLGLGTCCKTDTYLAIAVYSVYWCAALGPVHPESGYLFGGIYSDTQDNSLTRSKGCPPSFYPRMFLDLEICISDDFELGHAYSVPFGGFMSCSSGNPLSLPGIQPVGLQATEKRKEVKNSLHSFMADSSRFRPSEWPKHCPRGYSQHLVTIEDGCEIRYCLKSGALGGSNLPKIKLPPFKTKPNIAVQGEGKVAFNKATGKWFKNKLVYDRSADAQETPWQTLWKDHSEDHHSGGLSQGAVAAISVAVTLSCGIVALLLYSRLKGHRRRNGSSHPLGEEQARLISDTGEDAATGSPGEAYGSLDNRPSNDSCTVNLPTPA